MQEERIYQDLADALDRLPNGFPRTATGVELRLLQEIFPPPDARLAASLGREWQAAEAVAQCAGLTPAEAQARLFSLAERGLVWPMKREGVLHFRLAPFVIGIYEAQLERMNPELARLIDEYMDAGGALGIMGAGPALHRVVPAYGAIKPEWILPYDDVRALLDGALSFHVRDCVCRAQMQKLDRPCAFPMRTCITYYTKPRPAANPGVSREEAIAVLDQAEEIGLVHTVSNVRTGSLLPEGVGYICNCCGCCCMVLRGVNRWGIADSVAHAAYWAEIDAEECSDCGTCIARCQVHAISLEGDEPQVDRRRCIGCGLCVTGCPVGAVRLRRRPTNEIAVPPLDFEAWQDERARRRARKERRSTSAIERDPIADEEV
ncbi:MAG: 4Fe-4S dicluster domain-containing protein [Candidatus Eisenbacteria bacterium]